MSSDKLHRTIVDACGLQEEGRAVETVQRAMRRIDGQRSRRRHAVTPHVTASADDTFTTPDRRIYLADRDLATMSEAEIAMLLARQIAHHDLGHLRHRTNEEILRSLPHLTSSKDVVEMARARLCYSPQQEQDASAYAAELCRRAGYAVERSRRND